MRRLTLTGKPAVMIKYLACLWGCVMFLPCFPTAQPAPKRTLSAIRVEEPPRIDAILDDSAWREAPVAGDFIQLRPYNGRPSPQRTEVRFLYDDKAVYVGARIFDTAPDSIVRMLGIRDDIGMADYFGVYFDPYNDGQTAYGFFVSCAGVQLDMRATIDGMEDSSWDAVWKSEVAWVDGGWVAEYAIPYSALRFPRKEEQLWGLNIFRSVRRLNMNTSWNFIDLQKNGWLNQAGELRGIRAIEPPVRLSLTPYLSAYLESRSEEAGWGSSFKGGMDLKYGLSESFTLDMMLIPDFGQVQSDDQELNLSPFELYFSERRPFFMEGAELFSKANLFYSRRIGGAPRGFDGVEDSLRANEEVFRNPRETRILNVAKVAGKFNNNLSIALLNGMTLPSFATLRDTLSGERRKLRTQAFTNYNVLVLDRSIGNNSFVSLANTNVNRTDDDYVANVTGAQFRLNEKSNTYGVEGSAALSQIWEGKEKAELGHRYYLEAGKVSGKWRYGLEHLVESDTYDPNDMGFLENNNEISTQAYLRYMLYEPKGFYQNLLTGLWLEHETLCRPQRYVGWQAGGWLDISLKNNGYAGMEVDAAPVPRMDFFEPRVEGRKFARPPEVDIEAWYQSDWSKDWAYQLAGGANLSGRSHQHAAFAYLLPRYRFNSHFWLSWGLLYIDAHNDVGYVDHEEDERIIFFGERNQQTLENTLESSYNFNSRTALSFRLRHYWSIARYDRYFLLQQNGSVLETDGYNDNADVNFNAFTIDLAFRWNFAPGSELAVVWKNAIYTDGEEIRTNYFDNLRYVWQSDQINSFSVRALYYLDYQALRPALKLTKITPESDRGYKKEESRGLFSPMPERWGKNIDK